MDMINVGIGFPTTDEIVRLVSNVSPRINVVTLGEWVSQERQSPDSKGKLDEALKEIEVLFMGRPPDDVVDRAPRLQWAQFVGTGVDMLAHANILGSRVTVTNVTGTNALALAEHCLMFMIMFAKKMPLCLEQQRNHVYKRAGAFPDFTEGRTVGILGMGGIGLEVARLAQAFKMRVLGLHRTAQTTTQHHDLDEVYAPRDLNEMLSQCDYVVVALPLTDATYQIIGETQFAAMKRTAYVVNVGRGKLIDEQAMVRALKAGDIAGAGLDVFETEPLNEDSELWDLPNVFITPHVAGDVIDNRARAAKFFVQNLARYAAGEPLVNVVDPERGY